MALQTFYKSDSIEAGCDEAGRGCLAGPVFAAAVILPHDYRNSMLDDSKKLSEKKRDLLRVEIEREAIAWAVARVEASEIDRINILNASIEAMHLALDALAVRPDHIIVDGNRFKPYGTTEYKTIIKGDGLYLSIAAASVLAKTHRDACMLLAHTMFPEYGWDVNKGYPTKFHREALAKFGVSSIHRRSFRGADAQLRLDL
jgi:ribonuclease HII